MPVERDMLKNVCIPRVNNVSAFVHPFCLLGVISHGCALKHIETSHPTNPHDAKPCVFQGPC